MCNKIGYATKHKAKAAKRMCQQAAERGCYWRDESRIYRCHCGSWHLTSLSLEELNAEVSA